MLDAVADTAGISRAEALRQGLRRLAADILGQEDPAHAFVAEMAGTEWPATTPRNLAARHDVYLSESFAYRVGSRKRRPR